MAKFMKKPVVIDAFQWTGGPDQKEDPDWICEEIEKGNVWFVNTGTPVVQLCIRTLEGHMYANRWDYIIKGIKGEIYPCKPDIFEATYEAVKEQA